MSARIRWSCVGCGVPLEAEATEAASPCPRCAAANPWEPSEEVRSGGRLDQCAVCGRKEIYREKSVNRALGLGVVIVAAALAPLTFYISLGVAAVIDALLYAFLPERGVCYLCRAEYRGFRGIPELEKFDLHVAQVMTRHTWPPGAVEKKA